MGKNRNNRIVNRQSQANGLAAANAAQTVQTDHLASAVQWAQKAEFGPALAWLTCGWHLTSYVRGALAADKGRTGGGGNLSAVRSNAKKIATGRILEATGGANLPDIDELVRNYSAYSLLSGHDEPLPSTCDAPWSGFRELGRLATRSLPESEGWTFAPIVDVAKAKQVYTDWLTSRPGGARITVASLAGSVNDLLGLAPKVKPQPASKPEATPAQDSGEKPATVIVPGSTVAPNATVNPPVPSEGTVGDNPAAPSIAAQEAQPDATEVDAPNPNYTPESPERLSKYGEVDANGEPIDYGRADDFDDTEDVEATAPESADTKSDLPKPDRKPAEESDPSKHKSAATIARDALLATRQDDIHASFYDLGQLLLAEKKGSVYLVALIQGVIDRSTDEDAPGDAADTVLALFNLLDLALKSAEVNA